MLSDTGYPTPATASMEDIDQETHRLSTRWTEELDRDVLVAFHLNTDEYEVEIDGISYGTYATIPQVEDALTTLLNS